jgi:hypothetical protein
MKNTSMGWSCIGGGGAALMRLLSFKGEPTRIQDTQPINAGTSIDGRELKYSSKPVPLFSLDGWWMEINQLIKHSDACQIYSALSLANVCLLCRKSLPISLFQIAN